MKIDQLNGLMALKAVIETKNFTRAAEILGISPSAISQNIRQIEKRIGVALLARTTRSTSLTEAGEIFMNEAGPAIDQILCAFEKVKDFSSVPTGLLRINLPELLYYSYFQAQIPSFLEKYPDITLELSLEDSAIDVIGLGFDAGIRHFDILAKDVTAIRLIGPTRFITVASPEYIKRFGRPLHPRELIAHRCICPRFGSKIYDRWEFLENTPESKEDLTVQVRPVMVMNSSWAALNAALEGIGIAYTFEDAVLDNIRNGELENLLPEYAITTPGFYLYYPSVSQVLPKLRVFIEHLKQNLNQVRVKGS